MADGWLLKQRKKLLFAAMIIVSAIILVGEEDDPGMVAQLHEGSPTTAPGSETGPALPVQAEAAPMMQGDDESQVELTDWYSQAGPLPAEEPAPIDDGHLVTDTTPFVSADPFQPEADTQAGPALPGPMQ